MGDEEIKIPKIDLENLDLAKMKLPILVGLAFVLLFFCVYTVDANENAVVLRFGKYNATAEPGLHFKIPIIDTVRKVKVDFQYKKEFGFRSTKPGIRTSYSLKGLEKRFDPVSRLICTQRGWMISAEDQRAGAQLHAERLFQFRSR